MVHLKYVKHQNTSQYLSIIPESSEKSWKKKYVNVQKFAWKRVKIE